MFFDCHLEPAKNSNNIIEVKKECNKNIKMCKKYLRKYRRTLRRNKIYFNRAKNKELKNTHKILNNSLKQYIEILNKEGNRGFNYNNVLKEIKNLNKKVNEEFVHLTLLAKECRKIVEQAGQANNEGQKIGLFHVMHTFADVIKPEPEPNDIRVGDKVIVSGGNGGYGVVTRVINDGGRLKYNVIYESDYNDGDYEDEGEDIFYRSELTKLEK